MSDRHETRNASDSASHTPAIAGDGILKHLYVSVTATIVLGIIVCGIYPLVVWGLAQAIFHDKAGGSLLYNQQGQVIGSRLIGQNFTDAVYFHPRPSAAGNGYDATQSQGSNLGPTSLKLLNGATAMQPSTQPTTSTRLGASAETVAFDGIKLRLVHYALDNHIELETSQPLAAYRDQYGHLVDTKLIDAFNDGSLVVRAMAQVPADAVTASASGLDPHISLANAKFQVQRVVEERNQRKCAGARDLTKDDVLRLIAENTDAQDLGFVGECGVNVLTLNIALDKAAPVVAPIPATQAQARP